jgi:hypothetical protein
VVEEFSGVELLGAPPGAVSEGLGRGALRLRPDCARPGFEEENHKDTKSTKKRKKKSLCLCVFVVFISLSF